MKAPSRIGVSIAALTLGLAFAPAASAASFSNPNRIEIVDKAPASPYPSEIAVSGLVGEVTDVNVSLNGLTHTHLDDVAVVVEGPGGEALMLLNGVGPIVSPPDPTSGVVDIDLTLDDGAATQLSGTTVPTTGSYRPANHAPGLDSFPPPGPGTSYGNPGPTAGGSATLASVFDGLAANGTWKLYVVDFALDDVGEIADGWLLDVTTDGVDNLAPVTTITSGPSGTISETSASFEFSANEPATFECKLDSAAFAPCTTPHGYSGLAVGSHTFSVRGTDAAANVGQPATRSFTVDVPEPPPPPPPPPPGGGGTVDSTAPSVSILGVKVKAKKRSAKVKVTFSGSDDVTAAGDLSFSCKLDKLGAAPCSSPKTYKKVKAGKHTIVVTATDAAGNSGSASKRFKVKKRK